MSSPNMYQSDAENNPGVNLDPHITGNPIAAGQNVGTATAGHTWLIIVGALVLLWLFGGVFFRTIRM